MLTNSLQFLLKTRLQTCDSVGRQLNSVPCKVFQKRMHLSAVPPPLTRSPRWCGDQANALTAALCWANLNWGSRAFVQPICYLADHIISLLSLPPLASCESSKEYFSPQTSYLWPFRDPMKSFLQRMSRFKIERSLEPEESIPVVLQARAPTLPS